ncbi:hypothetical protein AU476_19180 [Cupriavidus sp. UYMSc13B]|nr:hypothetical protein AU476_19180 [Cupriavidus sp. UYMSc13B]
MRVVVPWTMWPRAAPRASELARLQAQVADGAATSGYPDRVRRRVKPNIGFTEDISGNPTAVVAVQLAPDGNLISVRLSKSSGNTDWDTAVPQAVERSAPFPRDENGVAPASLTITFRPKD